MTVNIFKKLILVPPKCGSRFFEEKWGNTKILKPGSKLGSSDWIEVINREHAELHSLKSSKFVDEVKYIVLRKPYEFMVSAVHTEFIDKWNNISTDVDEEELINSVVNEHSQSHWHRHFFRELYLFSLKSKTPPTLIMLDDLNDFMKNEMGEDYTKGFSKEKYDFSNMPYWLSKNDLVETYIKEKYPRQWKRINFYLEGDMFFWNKLIQLCPTYTPTINKDIKKISLKNDLAPQPPALEYPKTIWCFGDSMSRGVADKCIGYYLGEKLKLNWVNQSNYTFTNADIIESICHHIPKIQNGDIISIGFSMPERFRLANDEQQRWQRFNSTDSSTNLKNKPDNISLETINELIENRSSELYIRELKYWVQLLKYTFKDNKVVVWHWGYGKDGFDGNKFDTFKDEMGIELDGIHWSEEGNKQFANWFVGKLNSGENFINTLL